MSKAKTLALLIAVAASSFSCVAEPMAANEWRTPEWGHIVGPETGANGEREILLVKAHIDIMIDGGKVDAVTVIESGWGVCEEKETTPEVETVYYAGKTPLRVLEDCYKGYKFGQIIGDSRAVLLTKLFNSYNVKIGKYNFTTRGLREQLEGAIPTMGSLGR
ncbi:hypothetical protein [Photobacterium angustum]|uniref:hypothetical protein n=1 Tax=Photobacterium angustum TaxID=661 RepID=UPI0005E5414F|nr:hypothetical protein [Photobacterium angustum]KJG00095.1 hypothetical protein UB35_19780 [Photobacterium angustum]PSV61695.1 hypothetical protein CTM95_20550 [Photobacterium angustum]